MVLAHTILIPTACHWRCADDVVTNDKRAQNVLATSQTRGRILAKQDGEVIIRERNIRGPNKGWGTEIACNLLVGLPHCIFPLRNQTYLHRNEGRIRKGNYPLNSLGSCQVKEAQKVRFPG